MQELMAVPEIPQTPYIFFLDQLTREMAASSGGKMANLGEIHNRLHLTTPKGFVITATAYQHFLEGSGFSGILADKLQEADITDLVRLEAVSQELQDLIRQADLPADLSQAITEAGQIFGDRYISVRSSAVGEDTELSFAGQFATLLNVASSRDYRIIIKRWWPANLPPRPFSIGNIRISPSMNCPWPWDAWKWFRPNPAG